MRLCVLTDEITQDLDEALAVCVRHGYAAIEVRSVWNTPPHLLTLSQCAEIAARATASGVSIAGFASPVFKTELPHSAAQFAECEAELHRAIERCRALGTGFIRIFSFFRSGPPDLSAAAAAMDTVLRRVCTDGLTFGVETGTRTNTPNAALVQQLVRTLGRSNVGVVWDPGNTVFSGFGTGANLGGLDDLQPADLMHVHVKDPLGSDGYVELGRGSLPWPAILAGLAARGYDGHLSLETHWRLGRVLTPQQRDEPWGDAFSAGGREASDLCMATLATWLAGAA